MTARSKHNHPRTPAFSLIEVLVVVSVIALLVSILLPSLGKAREQARAAVCLGNLHRLGHAAVFYTDRYNAYPPFRLKKVHNGTGWVDYVNRYQRKAPRWQWFFDYGVGPVINAQGVAAGSDEMTNDLFLCPSLKGRYERNIRNGAYGYNYQYLGNSREISGSDKYKNWPVRASSVRVPARTVLVADSRGGDLPHGGHSYALDPPRSATETGETGFGPDPQDAPTITPAHSPVEMRHSERGNVAFTDGHAEPMRLQSLGYSLNDRGIAIGNGPGARNHLWTGKGTDPTPIP